MNKTELFMYLLKSMILSGIFFGYYSLFLKNTIYHAYNRFYLLASMALSLVIPFLNLSMFTIAEEELPAAQVLMYLTSVSQGPVQESSMAWEILAIGLISALFVGYLAYSILRIYLLKKKNPVTNMGEFDFIETELDEAPFSFFNNLFWKKSISIEDEGGRKILQHELSHIRQNHSIDRLFSQTICAIFWMNPFNWIIQKELQNIHEFIADRDAVGTGEVDAFAKMLLQTYYGNHFLNPSHSFYYSSIKRRIIMLTTSKTPQYAYLRKVAVLPMLAFILALFSIQLSAQKPKAKKENVTQFTVTMRPDSTTFSDPKTGKKVFSVATRDMPPPPPPAAAPGPPTPPTPPDIKSIKVDTVEIRGTRNGKVMVAGSYYVNTPAKDQANIVLTPFSGQKDKPLIVIDGVITSEMNMNDIKPNDIKSMNILKGDNAKAKYGEKGASGVIEITTKKP
jgi:TonB-dependent SusC/RagA subfamily outer membrane receptor